MDNAATFRRAEALMLLITAVLLAPRAAAQLLPDTEKEIAAYVDGVNGLGVMGSGAHSPTETINPRTFPLLTQRFSSIG